MSGQKESGGQEKTEKATPQKLKKAKREGQIGNTPEIGAWFGMLAATWMLPGVFRKLMDAATDALVRAGSVIRDPDIGRATAALQEAVTAAVWAVVPMGIVIAVIGVAGVGVQGGIRVAPKLLKPKASKLNPLKGWKRMFGSQGAWQAVKTLGKSAAVALVVYFSVKDLIPHVYGSGSLSVSTLIDIAVSTGLTVLRFAAVTGLVLAIADFAVVRKRNNKQLKMTKYEVKQEHKQQEGDPLIKGQRQSKHREMSRKRMFSEIPLADVVLVNPTHVAVALKYEAGKGAPRVVAKGAEHVAARIRKIAEENRVPMVEDIPLARTLFATSEIGQEIPEDLYKAVAMVLAFVMTLKSRGSAAGTHRIPKLAPAPA